jgi:hypothetical protein
LIVKLFFWEKRPTRQGPIQGIQEWDDGYNWKDTELGSKIYMAIAIAPSRTSFLSNYYFS